jgi:hypothetical protein
MGKKYQTTKKQCEKKIKGLVCTQCGVPVTALETVDNSGQPTFWGGCQPCSVLCWGVNPRTYEIARRMVDEEDYRRYYSSGDDRDETEEGIAYHRHANIRGAVSLVMDVLRCIKVIDDPPHERKD